MKIGITLAILLAALMVVSNANYTPLHFTTGDDILHKLTNGNHNIYVLFFFMPDRGSAHLKSANEHLYRQLNDKFLPKNDVKDLYYAEVDISKQGYDNLLRAVGVDARTLANGPNIFVMEHGNGWIIKGPRAVSELGGHINELLENRDNGY